MILLKLKKVKYECINGTKDINKTVEQINRYSKDKRINKNNLRKYIVIFIGSEYIIEEIN